MHYSEVCVAMHASTTKSRDSALALSLHDYSRITRLFCVTGAATRFVCASTVYVISILTIEWHPAQLSTPNVRRDKASMSCLC